MVLPGCRTALLRGRDTPTVLSPPPWPGLGLAALEQYHHSDEDFSGCFLSRHMDTISHPGDAVGDCPQLLGVCFCPGTGVRDPPTLLECCLVVPLIHSDVQNPICYFSVPQAIFQNQAQTAVMLSSR